MKVFFIGETYRADAQTWLRGLKEFGKCEIETWEIIARPGPFSRVWRMLDTLKAIFTLGKKIKESGADILLSERITSYGFIAACTGFHPFVVAQQGITDVWPQKSFSTPFKSALAKFAFKKADLIQAWGEAMVPAMLSLGADPTKIKVLAKGIDLEAFSYNTEIKDWGKIKGVVTRSLTSDYNHHIIIKAARILKDQNVPVEINIIGDGPLMNDLKQLATELDINDIITWTGRIPNHKLPSYLIASNMYLSVPVTEGVSASLFEAMGAGAFPIVTDLPGTRAWINNEKNGFLVPVNNPESLAKTMIKAWWNKDLMKQALLFNRRLVEDKADFKKNIPTMLEWYNALIKNR